MLSKIREKLDMHVMLKFADWFPSFVAAVLGGAQLTERVNKYYFFSNILVMSSIMFFISTLN